MRTYPNPNADPNPNPNPNAVSSTRYIGDRYGNCREYPLVFSLDGHQIEVHIGDETKTIAYSNSPKTTSEYELFVFDFGWGRISEYNPVAGSFELLPIDQQLLPIDQDSKRFV